MTPTSPDHAGAPGRRTGSTDAILLMLAAMAVFSAMDGVSKGLTQRLSPIEVSWARYLFNLLFMVPVVAGRGGWRLLVTARALPQLGRGTLLFGSSVLFITALRQLPLADAAAVGFVAPLMVTALSIPLLGESVERQRWLAVLAGFAGVLVVVRPGGAGFSLASLLPVASAGCWAVSLIMTRRLAATESPLTTLLYTGLTGLALSSLLLPGLWRPPDSADWLLLVAAGGLYALGQFLLLKAFYTAHASLLAPFQYSQILWSTAIGFLCFGTLPDLATAAGAAAIIASGLYVWRRERRR
ncbi:MAG: DMT family transporter [Rhodospirillaceae bacterium]